MYYHWGVFFFLFLFSPFFRMIIHSDFISPIYFLLTIPSRLSSKELDSYLSGLCSNSNHSKPLFRGLIKMLATRFITLSPLHIFVLYLSGKASAYNDRLLWSAYIFFFFHFTYCNLGDIN